MFSRPSSPSSGDNWCEREGGREGGRADRGAERAARSEARTYARLRANSTRLVKFREISAIPRSRLATLRAPGCKEQGVTFESRVYAATRPGRGDGGGGGLRGRRERDTTLSCVKLGDRVGRSLIVPASELLSHVHTHRLTHTLPHTLSPSLFLSKTSPPPPSRQTDLQANATPVTHVHTDRHTRAPDRYLSSLRVSSRKYTHVIYDQVIKVLLSDYDCLPTALCGSPFALLRLFNSRRRCPLSPPPIARGCPVPTLCLCLYLSLSLSPSLPLSLFLSLFTPARVGGHTRASAGRGESRSDADQPNDASVKTVDTWYNVCTRACLKSTLAPPPPLAEAVAEPRSTSSCRRSGTCMHRLFDHSLTALPRCPTVCVCLCVSNASRPRARGSHRGSRSGKQGEKENR